MKLIKIVMEKEFRYFLRRSRQLGILIIFGIFLVVYFPLQFGEIAYFAIGPVSLLGCLYGLSMLTFRSEQVNKTINNLLASPLNLREIFLGKMAVVFILSYSLELLVFTATCGVIWFRLGKLPTPSIVILTLVIIPILGIFFVEVLVLGYVVLGNTIIIRITGLSVMAAFLNPGVASRIGSFISSPMLPIGLGFAAIGIFPSLLGKLDREWIAEKWKYSAS